MHRFLNTIGGYVRHQDFHSHGAGPVVMLHLVVTMDDQTANRISA